MFSTFEEMMTYYRRRNIFNQNDHYMIATNVVSDTESFLERIVRPKMHLGRLNYGDFIRILAILG